MTDPLRPDDLDEAPSSEPSTLVTSVSPDLSDHTQVEGALPSPLGDVVMSVRSPVAEGVAPGPPPESAAPRKPRTKMTLRIPDDEVARPSRPVPSSASPMAPPVVAPAAAPPVAPAAASPAAAVPRAPVAAALQPLRPDRIINLRIDTPTRQMQVPGAPPSPAPSPVPPGPPRPPSVALPPSGEDTMPHRFGRATPDPRSPPEEDSWTPFQPMAADRPSESSVDILIDTGGFEAADPGGLAARAPNEPARALPEVAPVVAALAPPAASPPASSSLPAAPALPALAPPVSPPPSVGGAPPPTLAAPSSGASGAGVPSSAAPGASPLRPPSAQRVPVAAPLVADSEDAFPEMVFEDAPSSRHPRGDAAPVRSQPEAHSVADAASSTRVTPSAATPASSATPQPTLVAVESPRRAESPAAAPVKPRAPSSPSVRAATDDEEISVELEPSVASEPPVSSDPRELAEISPEDVVSVEAVQAKAKGATGSIPPPPPMRPRASSVPSMPAPPKPARASGPSLSTATVKTSTLPDPTASQAPSPPSPAVTAAAPPPAQSVKPRPMVIVPVASPLAPPPMGDAASSSRRRTRPWWEELFNDDFIRTMAKITDAQIATEVDFIEESLGLDKGAMVLDLACGTGRHAIELTRRGYQVVGFDLSLAMLAKAADEAQDRNQKLNFVQGDMREMTFDGTFDGVYCWSTSFGFFEEEKNAAVIENVRRALKPGGQVLLDVVNRDFVAQQCPSLVWFEGDGCVCMDDMTIDWITSRMKVKRTMMMDDGRSREIEYSIRLYALHELGKLLHEHGFRVAQVSGRVATPGVFFGANSPRTLILAEKR